MKVPRWLATLGGATGNALFACGYVCAVVLLVMTMVTGQ